MAEATGPVFIGGTNGSGTRVYSQLLELAGVFQGLKKNHAFEPENVIQYTRPLVPLLVEHTRAPIYDLEVLPQGIREMMERWIRNVGVELQRELPDGLSRWGWKHPRNLFIVPLLNSVFDDCYFVLVLRDGRDMALASNKGDVRAFYQYLVKPEAPDDVDCTSFWSRVNSQVAGWCEDNLGKRFVCSRFEDLCADPYAEVKRIADIVGLELHSSMAQKCAEHVHKPLSLGRWRDTSPEMQSRLNDAGSIGLQRFGYVS